jgi:hypothetical protein
MRPARRQKFARRSSYGSASRRICTYRMSDFALPYDRPSRRLGSRVGTDFTQAKDDCVYRSLPQTNPWRRAARATQA